MRFYYPAGWEPHPDRCLVWADSELMFWIASQAQRHEGCLIRASRGAKAHQPLRPVVTQVVAAWRGVRAFAAIQIIWHRYPQVVAVGSPEAGDFLEIDFDLGNPSQGAAPAALHAGEWSLHRITGLLGHRVRTNPYRIARWMRRDRIAVERV